MEVSCGVAARLHCSRSLSSKEAKVAEREEISRAFRQINARKVV